MTNPVATVEKQNQVPVVNPDSNFALTQRKANALSQSSMVPQAYRGNMANCMVALDMAERLGASPLMVMQNLYIVHGNPGWSSKFLVATFNMSGKFSPIQYRFTGTEGEDNWGCVAYATDLRTGKEVEGPEITIALAKAEGWYDKKGSKWQTIPGLMLRYRSAAWLINTVAPEISMGIQTDDELHDMIDMTEQSDGSYATDGDALNAFAQEHSVHADTTHKESDEEVEVIDPETGEVSEEQGDIFPGDLPSGQSLTK